ncbi:hypothetical protein [Spartinivicinus poritis]|uniref:Uncharacterized protein n=1 Tax=Spartinivicinus poritis TaxID=2994640 RepID=A0ABT5UI35_9GAMM|nr:hypothetical protein [Spartinivicinus sp. A2-2]MDE1466053.1 hypothetical protein [Spartinivicinus sp. A2-2]
MQLPTNKQLKAMRNQAKFLLTTWPISWTVQGLELKQRKLLNNQEAG